MKIKSIFKIVSVSLIIGLLSACNSSANSESTGTHKIIMTHELPESFHKHKYMEKFKEAVEEKSDGRLEVNIYPAATLFKDGEAVEALGTGAVQMVWPVSSHFESLSESYGIVSLPFGITDDRMAEEAFRNQLTTNLNGYVEEKGVKVLGLLRTAESIFLAKDIEIKSIKDFKGMKIRTVSGHVAADMLGSVGATAISLPATELATSLSQGAIDGVNTSPDGWKDVVGSAAKYGYVVPDLQIFTYSMATDAAWFNDLPSDLQEIIAESADEIIVEQWKETKKLDEKYINEVVDDYGTINYATEEDVTKWEKEMEKVYTNFEKRKPEAYKNFMDLINE